MKQESWRTFCLANTYSIATPGLRRAVKRASQTTFSLDGDWWKELHDLLVEEYSDEDDNMEIGSSKEAAVLC